MLNLSQGQRDSSRTISLISPSLDQVLRSHSSDMVYWNTRTYTLEEPANYIEKSQWSSGHSSGIYAAR